MFYYWVIVAVLQEALVIVQPQYNLRGILFFQFDVNKNPYDEIDKFAL